MRVNSKIVGLLITLVVFGGIGTAKLLNLWITESTKVPITIKEGEFAGKYNPEDIRGSYTFGDIERSFKVPVEDLAKAFGVRTGNFNDFQVKSLEEMYVALEDKEMNVGTASVKYFVASYIGVPYKVTEEVHLPKPAAEMLKAKGVLTKEQLDYVNRHIVDIPGVNKEEQ